MRLINLFYHTLLKVKADSLLEKTLIIARTWYTKTEVLDGLFVGGYVAGEDFETLAAEGITRIIRLNSTNDGHEIILQDQYVSTSPGDLRLIEKKKVEIHRLNIKSDDSPEYPIHRHFDKCYRYITKSLADGHSVLIHCSCGISRSIAICLMYLMRKQRVSFEDAFEYVKSKRVQADPNPGFIQQLQQRKWSRDENDEEAFKLPTLTITSAPRLLLTSPDDTVVLIEETGITPTNSTTTTHGKPTLTTTLTAPVVITSDPLTVRNWHDRETPEQATARFRLMLARKRLEESQTNHNTDTDTDTDTY